LIIGHHYQIKDGLLLESATAVANSGEAVQASAGIYYVAPMDRGWQVLAYRYADVDEEIDHSKFWERHVCRNLAGQWAVKVAHPWNRLRKYLEEHPYGLPRGRVVCHGTKHEVFHGSDLPKGSGVTRGQIEGIFGIAGKAKWVVDDHEHCLLADKVAVQEILSLDDDWPAV
jgi:hypothetical protein